MQGTYPNNPERTYKILSRNVQSKNWTRLDIVPGNEVETIIISLKEKGLTKTQIKRIDNEN